MKIEHQSELNITAANRHAINTFKGLRYTTLE